MEKKIVIFILTLVMFSFFGITREYVAYATDNKASVIAKSGYDINGDRKIDELDFDKLADELVNQISDIKEKLSDACFMEEASNIDDISVVDLVRLKRAITTCTTKEIPDEFQWDTIRQKYVWYMEDYPVTEDGITVMKAMFELVTHITHISSGDVEIDCDEIYALVWDFTDVIDDGIYLPNPEKWIGNYCNYNDVGVKTVYHAYIEDDGGINNGYKLFIDTVYPNIGTAYYSMRVSGAVDDNKVFKIKEMFSGDVYIEKVTITDGYFEISIKSSSEKKECMLCVESTIIYDAFVSIQALESFVVDGTMYKVCLSTLNDGEKFIIIIMENTVN